MRLILALLPVIAMPPGPPPDLEATGREVVRTVREQFLDPAKAAAWAGKHEGYAAGLRDVDAFAARTNSLLAELATSHTRYYTPHDTGFFGLLAIFQGPLRVARVEAEGIGADFAEGGFVRRVFAGGPAEAAGLRRGDEVVSVDDRPFHPVLSFQRKSGQPVTLRVRRRAGETPAALRVVPRKVNPKQEWLESQRLGARVVERDGKKVAYMPFFSCAGGEHEELLRDAVSDTFSDADALVLDFRDGWGGCSPTFLDVFNPAAPVLTSTGRDGAAHPVPIHWKKPLVILINGGTRSGKEVVAFAVQSRRLGALVGERTSGAVVAGRPFLLADGSLLLLAVADTRVDGRRLEGQGVTPDVPVADQLPYAAGADPQLDRALDTAARATR